MLPLSICIITRNEEHCIDNCLASLEPLLSDGAQLVITDTGSTDKTVAIAQHYTKDIYHFSWCDDFSAARNFCAGKAINNLILFLDADELLQDISLGEFSDALIHFPTECAGMITLINPTQNNQTTTDFLARFYHKDFYRYQGIIHEQLFPIDGSSPQYQKLPITLFHTGYKDTLTMNQKAKRNLALLLSAYQKNAQDPYTLFQLGQTFRMLQNPEEALHYFEEALALDINPDYSYVQTLVEAYGYTLLDLKQYEKALELYGVYDVFAKRADFVFLMGLISMNNGLLEQAIAEFKKAVTIPLHSVEGVNSYSAHYNIGVIFDCTGHRAEAIANYQKCGNFPPALKRLENI